MNPACEARYDTSGSGSAIKVCAAVSNQGDDLAGVVVYGSFARGESGDRSDVDLLVVLGTGKPITRALYRGWEGVLGKCRDR